jgi:flagellar biosynthesis GTPase FlhF
MMLKRIEAETLDAALRAVAQRCGEDALIVETTRTRRGYAIVAARPPTAPVRHRSTAAARWTRGFAPLARAATRFGLGAELLATVERALIGTRVDVTRAGDPALPAAAIRILAGLLRTSALSLPAFRVTALVGPTGVGKTTTIAKLAAQARSRGESVALLTIDTYRIAAAEQLRSLAGMLGVPFALLRSPADIVRALARHAGADRIFIDTTGHGPFDRAAIGLVHTAVRAAAPACVLCVPAGARRADLEAVAEGFAPLGPRAAIVTKWDETRAPGEALTVAAALGLPVSHVTIGQEIPADIVAADSTALAAAAFAFEETETS